jgi:hypothetical protein
MFKTGEDRRQKTALSLFVNSSKEKLYLGGSGHSSADGCLSAPKKTAISYMVDNKRWKIGGSQKMFFQTSTHNYHGEGEVAFGFVTGASVTTVQGSRMVAVAFCTQMLPQATDGLGAPMYTVYNICSALVAPE